MAQLTSNYSSGLENYQDKGSGNISIGGGTTGAVSGGLSGAAAGFAVGGPVGAVIGGLFGGLFGSKKTKAPAAPTYEQIMSRNLTAQQQIQGNLLNLEGQYRPQYQGLQESTLNSQLYGGMNNQGYASMLEEAAGTQQGMASRVGSGYMNTLQGLSMQARNQLLSPMINESQNELNRQAMEGLYQGGNLSQDQQRQAYQNANSAMAMRGLTGRQGVAAGVLSNYGLSQDRLNANRTFAQNQMGNETKLNEFSLKMANEAYGASDYGKNLLASGNTMLGQYSPQIFNPESGVGIQAQGAKYNEGMAVARANMAQQTGLLNQIGMMGAMQIGAGSFKNLFGSMNNGLGNLLGTNTANVGTLGINGATNLGGAGQWFAPSTVGVGSMNAGAAVNWTPQMLGSGGYGVA